MLPLALHGIMARAVAAGVTAPSVIARVSGKSDAKISNITIPGLDVGSGANRRVLVFVGSDDGSDVSEVRVGGSTGTLMTEIVELVAGASGNNNRSWLWEITNPTETGAQDIYVAFSGTVRMAVAAVSFSSTSGSLVTGTEDDVSEVNTAATPAVTPASDSSLAISWVNSNKGSGAGNSNIVPATGATQTETIADLLMDRTATSTMGESSGHDGGVAVTHSWEWTTNSAYTSIIAAVPGVA